MLRLVRTVNLLSRVMYPTFDFQLQGGTFYQGCTIPQSRDERCRIRKNIAHSFCLPPITWKSADLLLINVLAKGEARVYLGYLLGSCLFVSLSVKKTGSMHSSWR